MEEEEVAPIVDADPFGQNLLETKDPLVEALKYLRPLEKAAPGQVSTWLLSFEIAVRRSAFLSSHFSSGIVLILFYFPDF